MNCKDIIWFYRGLADEDLLVLASLLVYFKNKCIGRIRLSKELGITERMARKIIDKLTREEIVYGSFNKCLRKDLLRLYSDLFQTYTIDHKMLSILKTIDRDIMDLVEKYISDLRDYIVLATNDPHSIEIIGYTNNSSELHIPRIPHDFYTVYKELLKPLGIGNNVFFVLWRKYRRYHFEASIIYGLYMICIKCREE